MVPGSSAVEQPAVNRLVAGSNPARGAKQKQRLTLPGGEPVKPRKFTRGSIGGSKVAAGAFFSPADARAATRRAALGRGKGDMRLAICVDQSMLMFPSFATEPGP